MKAIGIILLILGILFELGCIIYYYNQGWTSSERKFFYRGYDIASISLIVIAIALHLLIS